MQKGIVYLVGAGPGDPGLLTLRGRAVLEQADVVVYDRLIAEELLEFCRAGAEKIYVGKEASRHAMTQDEINALLVERANAGENVCRLKGGDPFVFGRGGEEALFCREWDVQFEIVPGVSSSIAAPAYAGIPVTQREVASSFAVVTGHTKDEEAPPSALPVADTIIFLMGVRALSKIVAQLLARGESPSTPVALVRWGTTPEQEVVSGTLLTIEGDVGRAGLKPPALIVVGDVVQLREQLQWFDNRPLLGKTVIVTRAREQSSGLVNGLRQLGARVLQCPTIRIEDLDDLSALDEAQWKLPSFDWVIFTSVNGVEKFWARLQTSGKDARAFGGAKIAAIGPATQQALAQRGLTADFVPESPISENVAAGLLKQVSSGSRVLVVRAAEGREVLEEKLRAAGVEVSVGPCYRTVPDNSNAGIARRMLDDGEVDWVTFTSSSTVSNFIVAIGGEIIQRARSSFRVACIGPITAHTAEEQGLQPDVVADGASVESLIKALLNEKL